MRAIFVKGLSQCTMSSRDIFASLHCKLAVPRFPEYFILGLNGFFVQLHVRLFGGRILTLFSVPEIEQECFHNNRYLTIASVVYITRYYRHSSYCARLSNNISEGGQRPTLPAPRHVAVHCLQCMWMCHCPRLACGQQPFPPLHILGSENMLQSLVPLSNSQQTKW